MLTDGLLDECPPPPGEDKTDERRRYYRLSRLGLEVAAAETERMAMLVRLARRKGLAAAR